MSGRTLACIALTSLFIPAVAHARKIEAFRAGAWHIKETWNPQYVPGDDDDVTIEGVTVILSGGGSNCRSLKIKSGGTLTTVRAASASLHIYGNATVNGTLTSDRDSSLAVHLKGDLNKGTLGKWAPEQTYLIGGSGTIQHLNLAGVQPALRGDFYVRTPQVVANTNLTFTGNIDLSGSQLDMRGKKLTLGGQVKSGDLRSVRYIHGRKKARLGVDLKVYGYERENITLTGYFKASGLNIEFNSPVAAKGVELTNASPSTLTFHDDLAFEGKVFPTNKKETFTITVKGGLRASGEWKVRNTVIGTPEAGEQTVALGNTTTAGTFHAAGPNIVFEGENEVPALTVASHARVTVPKGATLVVNGARSRPELHTHITNEETVGIVQPVRAGARTQFYRAELLFPKTIKPGKVLVAAKNVKVEGLDNTFTGTWYIEPARHDYGKLDRLVLCYEQSDHYGAGPTVYRSKDGTTSWKPLATETHFQRLAPELACVRTRNARASGTYTLAYTGASIAIFKDGENVTGRRTKVLVGEKIALSTKVAFQGSHSLEEPKWKLKTQSAIQGRRLLAGASSTVDELTEADLSTDALRFHWWKGGVERVTITGNVNGHSATATTSFEVTRPRVTLQVFKTQGAPGIYPDPDNEGAVEMTTDPTAEPMTFVHSPPETAGGVLQYVQLVKTTRRVKTQTASGVDYCIEYLADELELDSEYPYEYGKMSTGQSQNVQTNDRPGLTIGRTTTWAHVRLDFEMYVEFQPNTPDAIFVPVRVVTWNWDGESGWNKANNEYRVVTLAISHGKPGAPKRVPTWSGVATPFKGSEYPCRQGVRPGFERAARHDRY